MMIRKLYRATGVILFGISLSSCVTNDGLPSNYKSFDASDIPNAVPKVEPRSKYGNPDSYVVFGKRYYVLKSARCYHAKGIASWYGTKFHRRLTSSREPYNMYKMTAANKVLPLPTYVRVRNLENGRTIIVKVNDRGPFKENRVIDLSFAAAKKIGMMKKGTAMVEVTAIDPRQPNATCGVKPEKGKPTKTPQIYLQIGAFSTKSSADAFAHRVAQHADVPVFLSEHSVNHAILYKVQLGPISNVETADKITHDLETAGFGEAFAVVR